MHNLEKFFEAGPAAREGILTLNGKPNRSPTHLVNLIRKTDPQRVVDTIRALDDTNHDLLPHIGGFVVESQLVPTVLGGLDRSSQAALDGDTKFTNIHSVMEKLDRWEIIDPNLDRIFYFDYRKHIPDIQPQIPGAFSQIYQALNRDEEELGESIEHSEAHEKLRDRTSLSEIVDSFVSLQLEQNPDVILAPYYPIHLDSLEQDVERNAKLYVLTERKLSTTDLPVAAVIPLNNTVISADSEINQGQRHQPQEWIDIIQKYRGLDADVLFIKASNFQIDPDRLDKQGYAGLYHFFRLLRRFTDTPTLFLGLDEFAYILMAEGLDGYSHPLYKSPYRMPRQTDSKKKKQNSGTNHRRFIVPRNWSWKRFDQLDSLECNCVFCKEFDDVSPRDIPLSDQDELRNRHWLKLRDQELQEIHEAIREENIRAGLISLCADSEWKKNFNTFL